MKHTTILTGAILGPKLAERDEVLTRLYGLDAVSYGKLQDEVPEDTILLVVGGIKQMPLRFVIARPEQFEQALSLIFEVVDSLGRTQTGWIIALNDKKQQAEYESFVKLLFSPTESTH